MTTLRRVFTIAMVAVGIAVFGAATAQAQDSDEQFEKAVNSLGITAGDDTDLAGLGRNVCNTLAVEMARNPNPAPLVRNLVASLQNANLSRAQAVGFMRVSVAVYCPQFTGIMPG
ncbi:hypothetical protein BST36_21775 [Mycolicibacterium moriokaense]|jgi:hypothetical protein|uniref:DUF732 domain-containing protein n=1 Tax=Mycolicibacterium moriokaense TaxID=39691 RepID=A0AAD1HGD7_9MYCO|nr:DUF732 domain-containing protein [Mycolicibacterium moriokaense]MCV7041381.1 DUF732 domain-containing protein [Mycolicibacterium moriokaense]ORB19406.1 hypothetical protein BST36_21775 [Mycolicibacterium moriokaense]BBX04439.1 hypothetical protein MMOR_53750 [Mycolicibacterium moriokaense]